MNTARLNQGTPLLLNAVSKHYAENIVLNQLDLHIPAGQFVAVVGRSGGGKSTLLRLLAGLETPTAGDVLAGTTPLAEIQEDTRMMFQDARLLPWKSVIDNVGLGLKGQWRDAARRALAAVGLENRAGEWPAALSGGQKQRVALARIMAYEPDAILLDEPFSALDEFLKDKLQQELMEMLEDYPGTVILVSHSRDEIYRFSEELVIMDKGKVVCAGKTEEIFAYPEWKEAARLTGCKNITKVIREDAHHLQVPAWEICLALKQEISEEIQYIGIRAHDFVPVWDEISDEGKRNQEKANENLNNNRIPAKIESVAKLPFEHRFFLWISEKCREENVETEASENVCWFVQRDQWKMLEERGLPAWLYLPEEKILLLK